jgi:hydrogenase nickel incorporation protein HypB
MCDHCGCDQPAGPGDPSQPDHRTIKIEQDVLAHDRAHAQQLRRQMAELNARLVNIIGSPGCGKTALVCALISRLRQERIHCVVVEGDLATDNDAKKIRETGARAFQVTTGTACHLTAHDVARALEHLKPEPRGLVLVENVGNLVCPTMFDLGETLRMVCLSVTEGTDKPQKYPVTFSRADVVAITKHDLLEHVDFDLLLSTRMIDDIKPGTECVVTSAANGLGINRLVDLIRGMWE